MRVRAFVPLLVCAGCVYVGAPGDPAPPDRPPATPKPAGPGLPTATRWDGQDYCRVPFSTGLGWADPIGHLFGLTQPVEHLYILLHDVAASGRVIPSPNLGANDEVDIDGDWNFLVILDPGQELLLGEGNFDHEYAGGIGAEIDHTDLPEPMWPRPGDRVWMRGDWVVDCWKDIAQGEIHPAFAVVVERGDQRWVNYVRRSGVFTDLLDGVRDQRVDPDPEVTFHLVPTGPSGPGQRAALLETLDRQLRGVAFEDVRAEPEALVVHVRLDEGGQYYAHLRVGWR